MKRLQQNTATRRELRDELDYSRSTAYKIVRELTDANIIERRTDEYSLTLTGRLLTDEYQSFRNRVEATARQTNLLNVLAPTCELGVELLVGADVELPERYAPTHPVQTVERVVRDADAVVGVVPVALPQYVDVFHDVTTTGDLAAELVVESRVVEYLTADFPEKVREVAESGNLTVLEAERTLPFGLLVTEGADPCTCVVVYDEGGELRGVIVNDTDEALAWGCETYRRFRDAVVAGN